MKIAALEVLQQLNCIANLIVFAQKLGNLKRYVHHM